MTAPLLTTKLYIPPPRPNLVPRPRLIERLSEGLRLGRRLTLISAPAGFGKTTLLSEWAAGCDRPIAWLSLDEGDNDPARFLAYFVAALQTVEADIGAGVLTALQSLQPPPMEVVLTTLLNDIAAVFQGDHGGQPYVLVLDDYHMIRVQPIHDALGFLLDHFPAQMHLAIATRADPPLPLPRLRIQGELTELRAADLRFTFDEVAAFFNEVTDLDLSARDVTALESRTEGWIAGLQAAALSLQGRTDVPSFIQTFTGSHRFVLDYLVEEVFQRQPGSVQTFLLQTSILVRLTGPLCDAITDQSNGQAMLETLERANLFIVSLDDERRWYRYHRLFADLLRARLEDQHPDRMGELHRRAAQWYEQNGLIAEAVSHALAARDFGEAARLVEQIAPATLWARGEVATFLSWLEALPEDIVRARPRLGLYHAWALLTTAQLDGVEERLQDVERAIGEAKEAIVSESEVQGMLGEVAVTRAMVANFRGDRPRAIELCNQALEIVPENNLFLRTVIAGNLGGAYSEAGDVVAASQAFAEASRLSQATGNTFTTLMATSYLGNTQMILGRLRDAAQTYWQTLELAAERGGQHLVGTAVAHVGLGDLLRERNDLDGARRHLMAGIELSERQGDVVIGPGLQILLDGYLALAKVHQARGDKVRALETIHRAEQVAQRLTPVQTAQVAAARARLWMLQGDLTAASRWAQERGLAPSAAIGTSIGDEPSYPREFECLTLARVLIAQGEADEAIELLARLGRAAEAASRMGSAIEILALQALAFQTQGDIGQAMTALERALSLAEPEGYVRTFVDEGAPMEKVLRHALSRGTMPDYVRRLLASSGKTAEPVPPVAQPLVEPLSPRELEVLRLIADGLSNQEIAEELFIAITTVKKHASNIFGKLGVANRTQAVARARELDLI